MYANRRLLQAAAMLLAIAFLVGQEAQPAVAATAGATPALATRFDGETLFRGLAFGQGPVAQLFPELAKAPTPSPQAAATIDAIIAQMRALDSQFFPAFASDLQSGNRVRVRSALEAANTLGQRAIESLDTSTNPGPSPSDVFLVVETAVVLVDVVAAVVVVALVFFFAPTPALTRQSAISRDKWADKIARTL